MVADDLPGNIVVVQPERARQPVQLQLNARVEENRRRVGRRLGHDGRPRQQLEVDAQRLLERRHVNAQPAKVAHGEPDELAGVIEAREHVLAVRLKGERVVAQRRDEAVEEQTRVILEKGDARGKRVEAEHAHDVGHASERVALDKGACNDKVLRGAQARGVVADDARKVFGDRGRGVKSANRGGFIKNQKL